MEPIEALFSLTVNLFSTYLNIRVIKLFLTPRKKCVITPIFLYAGIWIVNWLVYFFFDSPILTLSSLFAGLLAAALLFYNGNLFIKLMSVTASIVLGFISEDIIWIIFSKSSIFPNDEALGTMFSSFISLAIILLLENFLHFTKGIRLSRNSYINIIIISVGSAVICDILVTMGNNNHFLTMLGLSMICLINVSTYFQYDKINEAYQKTLEQKSMEQRIAMYQNQFELINQSQENIRSIRHDMKNHLLLLSHYIRQGHYKDALSYIDETEMHLDVSREYTHTGNNEIDSILNYLLNQAEQLHCEIETQIKVPNEKIISDFDLNMLLSNLLENALDALKKVEKKYLNILIRYDKNILYISVYNSFNGQLNKKKDVLYTTKKDTQKHGYGLRNIQSIIEKYDGESIFQQENNIFKADIILHTTI